MDVPDSLRYSSDHEWARIDAGRVRVGITDYAQDALGDIVFVDLPAVGDRVTPGQALGEVESTKSVSEIYAPVGGTVVSVNGGLTDTPEQMNSDPYGDGMDLRDRARGPRRRRVAAFCRRLPAADRVLSASVTVAAVTASRREQPPGGRLRKVGRSTRLP